MSIKSRIRSLFLLPSLLVLLFATHGVVSAPAIPPNPVLYLTGTEAFQQGGKTFIRYKYDVFNKEEYPAAMFTAAPNLPPCGANTKSSRTWIDIFDSRGKRLFGFCAISKPADLNQLWFALEDGVVPPSYVYIEMNDRQTNTKYKSNLADTSE
ncbi:MAG TPA: hypothetical protein VGC60_14950 [Pyrinomonadaceae bacterium]